MSTLAEVLAQGIRIHDGNHDKGAAALGDDLAAVVAEWLTGDRAVGVVTSHARNSVGGCICGERGVREPFARHVAAALAAHAKGEAS